MTPRRTKGRTRKHRSEFKKARQHLPQSLQPVLKRYKHMLALEVKGTRHGTPLPLLLVASPRPSFSRRVRMKGRRRLIESARAFGSRRYTCGPHSGSDSII
eukprot:4933202-Pleurochrysis_carterae.AAC.1